MPGILKQLSILLLLVWTTGWSAKRVSTIAVMPFENSNARAQEQGLGKVIAAMLGTHLRNETNFVVLERSYLHRILEEQQFSQMGLTEPLRKKLRQLYAVEVLLVGDVSEVGGLIQIDLRLISTETGEVVVAEWSSMQGAGNLRESVARLARTVEDQYLRQWMGNLNVAVQPVEGEVYLDKQYMGKASLNQPLKLTGLLEGDYSLKVLAGGYQAVEQKVVVSPRTVREIQIALPPIPGALSIQSDPVGATVFLNGAEMGQTPYTAEALKEGAYQVRLLLKNFKIWKQNVMIHSGQQSDVKAQLEVIPGKILVHSEPSNASVRVDQRLAGVTPLLLENVKPGSMRLSMEKPGYKEWNETVVVKPGEQTHVSKTLQRQTGKVTLVSVMKGLDARILNADKQVVLQQKIPFHKHALNAGTYSLEVSQDKYFTKTIELKISPDQETRLEVELERKPGKLVIAQAKETPVDLFIDSVYKGKAGGLEMMLPEGEHQVLLRGHHGEKNMTIQIVADETVTIPASSLQVDRHLPWYSALAATFLIGLIVFSSEAP